MFDNFSVMRILVNRVKYSFWQKSSYIRAVHTHSQFYIEDRELHPEFRHSPHIFPLIGFSIYSTSQIRKCSKEGLFIAGIESGLIHCDKCSDPSSNIWKKVMGNDTGFGARKVVSRLLMNGFRSGFMRGDQCN
jgi:hypothetical protein